MPNKTLYIRDEDLPAWERADQASKAADVSTSQIVAAALRQYLPSPKDIQVVYKADEGGHAFDGRPQLEYGYHASQGRGWMLNHYLQDEHVVEGVFTRGDLGDAHQVIASARRVVADALAHPERKLEEITVEVGDPQVITGFVGRWLVEPDRDKAQTAIDGYGPAGEYMGVALTKRGRIAVYIAYRNENSPPARLEDYDTLDDAKRSAVPAHIAARAAQELGEYLGAKRVIWRDI
ncbi:hypothetical protein [Actinomadura sp. 6N118]|uniref:hypothetical protein n=1 Tax=Actinomadura sp. 6N118 TaxID=3375151 RepID=UPI003791BA7C